MARPKITSDLKLANASRPGGWLKCVANVSEMIWFRQPTLYADLTEFMGVQVLIKRCFWPALAVLLLAACGGSSSDEDLSGGIGVRHSSMMPTESGYGIPADETAQANMAQRLHRFFAEQHEQLQDTPMPDVVAATNPAMGVDAGVESKARVACVSDTGLITYECVHRFFNTITGVHFYTTSEAERQNVISRLSHYRYEGTAFKVSPAMQRLGNYVPYMADVYRFYNRITGTHFYTASEAERNRVVAELGDVFSYEGAVWSARRSPYPGWVPVHRFYNRATGVHFYTASQQEVAQVQARLPQFQLEGVAYWVRSEEVSPAGAWRAPAGVVPATGNYIYYEGQNGNFIVGGQQELWTATNSRIQVTSFGGSLLRLEATGMDVARGFLFFPDNFNDWRPGLYTNASRFNAGRTVPSGPELDFSMGARGCGTTSGWISLDSVQHDADGSIASFELRFEQLCQWDRDVLRGQIRWSKYDTAMPPGPVTPIPGNLWRPSADRIPDQGNFIYFEGDKLVYRETVPGYGRYFTVSSNRLLLGSELESANILHPQPVLSPSNGGYFGAFAFVAGSGQNEWVNFGFGPMWFMGGLTPGYYGDVTRTPNANPARGTLLFEYASEINVDESLGCSFPSRWSTGWFVVDDVAYQGNDIERITLRFEVRCSGWENSTRGMIRWDQTLQ